VLSVAAVADVGHDELLAVLLAVIRPEFAGPIIRVDPDDPVFGRGRCGVAGCARTAWARQLCAAHHQRWTQHGKPAVGQFRATTGPIAERAGSEMVDAFDLSALAARARLEVAYVLQARHDDRSVRVPPSTIRHLVGLLTDSGADSLLDRPFEVWLDAIRARGWKDPTRTIALLRYAQGRLRDLGGIDIDDEFASDIWVAARIGLHVTRSPNQTRFDTITQPWLRAAVKRWARLRLGSGKTFGTVHVDVRAMVWFGRFLARHDRHGIGDETAITRDALEAYLVWIAASHLAPHTSSTYITCLRGFLDTSRRHHWLPALSSAAALYHDDLPSRPRPLPRFIAEFVMNQLEDPDHLAVLPDTTTRALIVVIIETGLRANDACSLPFNPIINDSAGWPCLRYFNAKMAAEQLVPLSPTAAATIRAQQGELLHRWPGGPPVLFPAPHSNPDGSRPFSYATLRARLARWQDDIDVRDEAGQPVRVTAHQFRHTLGTRLINQGVAQHVIQRLLGHASPQMTARYASLHDTTVRAAFDEYCRQRVNLHGERIVYDPVGITAEAEWTKHNMTRVQASLPNGYCGRPPQQHCPHPNACLTCPDFQTTPAFLDVHRRQRDETRVLIATAEADGRFRLAANHRHVHDNLDQLIGTLETIGDTP
jgi:integrase